MRFDSSLCCRLILLKTNYCFFSIDGCSVIYRVYHNSRESWFVWQSSPLFHFRDSPEQ